MDKNPQTVQDDVPQTVASKPPGNKQKVPESAPHQTEAPEKRKRDKEKEKEGTTIAPVKATVCLVGYFPVVSNSSILLRQVKMPRSSARNVSSMQSKSRARSSSQFPNQFILSSKVLLHICSPAIVAHNPNLDSRPNRCRSLRNQSPCPTLRPYHLLSRFVLAS